MTLRHWRAPRAIGWFCLLALGASLACQLGAPQPQVTATTAPGVQTTTSPAVSTAGVTITAPSQGKAAAGTIMLDQTSAISKGNQVEMSFDGVAEQVISLDVNLVSGKPQYQFHLVDKFGNFIANFTSDPANTTETISEFTLPYDGTYKIVLMSTAGDGSVEVAVTAASKASGGGKISDAGQSIAALAGTRRTYHTYYLSLTQGQVVNISAKANVSGLPDTSMVLYGPDGQYVTDADDVSAPSNLDAVIGDDTVATTGTYVAIVTNKGAGIGAYTFAVTPGTIPPEAQGEPSVVYARDYPLSLVDASNADLTFDGALGDVLRIQLTGLSPDVSADLYLFSPFGQTIAYAVTTTKGQSSILNEVQLPYAGRYKLEVRPTGNGQGIFRIDHLASADLTGGGAFGDNPTESLPGRIAAPNVFHYYQFTAKAGDTISLAVFSVSKTGKLDMGFGLLGPNGRQIVFADDSDSDNPKDPELKDFVILQNGTYTVIVYSFTVATGTYDIELKRNQ